MSEHEKSMFPVFFGYPKMPSGRKLGGKRPIVGRDELLVQVKQRLLKDDNVALHGGLPGSGKTEMAAQLVKDAQLREHFKDGILWVGLGDKLRNEDVSFRLSEWAAHVGVPRESLDGMDNDQIANAITTAIWPRSILLVIDDAWDSETASIFRRGGDSCAHLLTTRLFHVANNFAYGDPIPVPELDDAAARELLAQYIPEIVEERPKEVEECIKIAAGLPLALNLIGILLREAEANGQHELNAALKKVADVKEFFRQELPYLVNDDYERWSSGGKVPPNLGAIIEMSTESLKEEAREALQALTVFPPKVNTFSFDAGVFVAGSSAAFAELRHYGLAEITDRKSDRYTMHMAIWEYAHQGLEDKSAYKRMAKYFINYIDDQETAGRSKTLLLESLEQEHDNLRYALDQLIDLDEAELGLQLAGALWKFWYERSYFGEGRQYIGKLCNLPSSKVPALGSGSDIPEPVRKLAWARAKALNDAGNFAYNQGDLFHDSGNSANSQDVPPRAEQLYNESLKLREQIDDEQGQAGTWNNLGLLARARGDYSTAERHFRRALGVNQDKGNQSWAAINLNNLGVVAACRGDGSTAREFQQESLARFQSLEDDWGIAMALSDLGAALLLQGDYAEADAHYKESLERRWQIKDMRGIASALLGLAAVSLARARDDLAIKQYKAALGKFMDLRDRGGMIEALEGLAATACVGGDAERAVRLYAAAEAFRHKSAFAIPPVATTARKRELAKARVALGGERFHQIRHAAADASLDDVTREALEGPAPLIEHVIALSLDEGAEA